MGNTADFLHPRDEIMRMIERIYRYRMATTSGGNISLREEDGAVLNASPVNATAFSVTAERLDSRTTPESYLLRRDVGRVPYGVQFREPERLAAEVSPARPVALLENDGVLALGATILEAFDRLEVLESTAEAVINSRLLGEVNSMSDEVIVELDKAFGFA